MLTDLIADFINRLRNASHARRKTVSVKSSRLIKEIAQVLANKRFIENFEVDGDSKAPQLIVTLRTDREPLFTKRISKPGQRIYTGHKEIRRVRNGLGIALISTSKGILTDDEARKQKAGGEYLCEIY